MYIAISASPHLDYYLKKIFFYLGQLRTESTFGVTTIMKNDMNMLFFALVLYCVEPWRGGSVLASRPEGRGFDPRLCCLLTVKPPLFVGRINLPTIMVYVCPRTLSQIRDMCWIEKRKKSFVFKNDITKKWN